MAGLVILERGLVFADIGWSYWGNVRHPFHYVSGGQVFGRGPWYVGLTSIERMASDDPMMADVHHWRKFEAERSPDPKAAVEQVLLRYAGEAGLR